MNRPPTIHGDSSINEDSDWETKLKMTNGPVHLFSIENGETDSSIEEMSASDFMLIGEISAAVGVEASTIRYFEREKLMMPSRHGNFRVYNKKDFLQLKKILSLRHMGLSTPQIRHILSSVQPQMHGGEVSNLLLNHLESLRSRMTEVSSQIASTMSAIDRCQKMVA